MFFYDVIMTDTLNVRLTVENTLFAMVSINAE